MTQDNYFLHLEQLLAGEFTYKWERLITFVAWKMRELAGMENTLLEYPKCNKTGVKRARQE